MRSTTPAGRAPRGRCRYDTPRRRRGAAARRTARPLAAARAAWHAPQRGAAREPGRCPDRERKMPAPRSSRASVGGRRARKTLHQKTGRAVEPREAGGGEADEDGQRWS
eukprot:4857535-Prymnesium_polylepis.1